MKAFEYIPTEHKGELCPVPPNRKVIYRTKTTKTDLSHIHAPMEAIRLNWTNSPAIGRIIDYMVIK